MTCHHDDGVPLHDKTTCAVDHGSRFESTRYLGHVIDNVRQNPEAYEVVLDIGCGSDMRDLGTLQNLGIKFAVGIDIQRIAGRPSHLQMEYIRCDVDAADLPFTDSCINLILMNNVIEHLYHPKETLEECRRCLSRDGRIALLTPNQARLINRIRLLLGHSIYFPLEYWLGSGQEHITRGGRSFFTGHIREYTVEEIRNMLNGCGFMPESIVLYDAREASPRERTSKSRILLKLYNLASKVVPNSRYMISVIARKI